MEIAIKEVSPPAEAVSEAPGGHGELSEQIYALIKAGKYQEALDPARQLLNRQENRLGPEAPEVAGSLQRLGNIHMLLGNFLKAIALYQRALQIREKVLGPGGPEDRRLPGRLGAGLYGNGSL